MTQRKTTRAQTSSRSRPRSVPATEPPAPSFHPPYRASWFDRFTAFVERLPGPYWVPYAVAFLAHFGLAALLAWQGGRVLTRGAALTDILPYYGFWLIHYLNLRAASALQRFRTAFIGTESDLQDTRWRLTTLPATPALVISLIGFVLGVVSSLNFARGSPESIIERLAYYATTVFASLYAYHTIRQLRLVTWLYAKRAVVDIHNVAPLYSFSTLSAQTAIGMLLILSGAVLITPQQLTGVFLVGTFLFGALAVLTFLLPLTGLHHRLAEAKEQELLDNNRRWQACTAELYRRVDRRDWAGADRLNTTLTALERGRVAIERIPTWPWRPETLRSLVAALLLPITIWLIQFGLQKVLG